MIYQICKKLIQMGKTEGLADKIDVYYLAERLIKDQYEELMDLLKGNE